MRAREPVTASRTVPAPDAHPTDLVHHLIETLEEVLRLPEPPESRWHRAGVSARAERRIDLISGVVVVLLVAGWSYTIAQVARERAAGITGPRASVTAAITSTDAPNAAFLTDAALGALAPLRGASGRLRVALRTPGEALGDRANGDGAHVTVSGGEVAAPTESAPAQPGIFRVAVAIGNALRPIADFNVISMVPFSSKERGRIGTYFVGNWPGERGRAPRSGGVAYAPPRGFVEVTLQNRDTHVSEHFRLRDFLTKDQPNVWPKYLVLEPKLLDKLELVLTDLRAHGIDTKGVKVMSGFRTPNYNASGGDTRGRASLSRHMYGDAADIFIDNDGNGNMDDLNRDGRVDLRDARVIEEAVTRVERAHPALVGGCGVYVATSAHGPFAHIDTRGYRARWVETGDSE